jgi:hypothetical protein
MQLWSGMFCNTEVWVSETLPVVLSDTDRWHYKVLYGGWQAACRLDL